MTDVAEARRRLTLFGIPCADVLARLVAGGALSLGEMQTARDIVERADAAAHPAAYLFLAAMFVALRNGSAAFDPARAENADGRLLADAGWREGDPAGNAAFAESVRAAWPEARTAAEAVRGDIVERDAQGRWFFAKYAEAARFVRDALARRRGDAADGEPLDDALLAEAAAYEEFPLNDRQRAAVRTAVARRLTIVTGGPGTGKTTVVCSILRALCGGCGVRPDEVALVAPTGRAAQRMGEALRGRCAHAKGSRAVPDALAERTGTTVHALLGGRGPHWRFNERNPLPHRVVVVDECSMVDLLLMRALLAALDADCRLILLGDRDQLPSVGAGAVFGELMELEPTGRVELVETVRFGGDLKTCADAIRRGDAAAARAACEGIWLDAAAGTVRQEVDARLLDWAAAHGLAPGGELAKAATNIDEADLASLEAFAASKKAKRLFDALEVSRVLTVVREGPFGVRHVNELLSGQAAARGTAASPLGRPGVPVLVTRNTPARGLFNGDVGVTVRTTARGASVLFRRGATVVRCPVTELPEHELAYATTVHKGQGSEFDEVLVVLPDEARHPLLTRQLVYTGVTRARHRAVVLGTEEAFRAALARTVSRDTGLA